MAVFPRLLVKEKKSLAASSDFTIFPLFEIISHYYSLKPGWYKLCQHSPEKDSDLYSCCGTMKVLWWCDPLPDFAKLRLSADPDPLFLKRLCFFRCLLRLLDWLLSQNCEDSSMVEEEFTELSVLTECEDMVSIWLRADSELEKQLSICWLMEEWDRMDMLRGRSTRDDLLLRVTWNTKHETFF